MELEKVAVVCVGPFVSCGLRTDSLAKVLDEAEKSVQLGLAYSARMRCLPRGCPHGV